MNRTRVTERGKSRRIHELAQAYLSIFPPYNVQVDCHIACRYLGHLGRATENKEGDGSRSRDAGRNGEALSFTTKIPSNR